jgi:hypothetical protein
MPLQLGVIFSILGFLISPWGLMCLLAGVTAYILLPLISTVSSWKAPANLFLRLATFPIDRAAVVISEHNDALFKTMKFDGLGVEIINIDDEDKVFEDPDNALHYFLGIPFALADEEHGVLFDPRHAAVGERKRAKDKRDESMFLATDSEFEQYNVAKWMPAVFEFPRAHELIDLSAVQELIDGGERSEYAERVEELYKHSRDPFGDGTGALQYLYPIIAFAITFGGIWFMVSQFGIPSLGPTDSVSFSALLALAGLRQRVPWPKVIAGAGLVVVLGILALTAVFINPLFTLGVVVALSMGFLALPVLTFMAQVSAIIGGLFSKLYFKLGFFGYRQPVICWTESEYVVRELDEIEHTDGVEYYGLFGHTIGFTFDPTEASWGPEAMAKDDVASQQPVADGGTVEDTNLPNKFLPSHLSRDTYGKYLPKRLSDSKYYVDAGMALERFNNSADGEKSLKKLLEAKELHGSGSDGLDDNMVFKASMFMGVVGALLGIGIFIVPSFL